MSNSDLLKKKNELSDEINQTLSHIRKKKYSCEKAVQYLNHGVLENVRILSELVFKFLSENITGKADETFFNFATDFIDNFYEPYYIEKYKGKKFYEIELVWFTELNSILLLYINNLGQACENIRLLFALAAYSKEKNVSKKKFESLCNVLSFSDLIYSLKIFGYNSSEETSNFYLELYFSVDEEIDDHAANLLKDDFFTFTDKIGFQESTFPESLRSIITQSSDNYIMNNIASYPDMAMKVLNDTLSDEKSKEAVEFIVNTERRKRQEIKSIEEKFAAEFAAGILERTGNPAIITHEVAAGLDMIRTARTIAKRLIEAASEFLQNESLSKDPVLADIKRGFFIFSDIVNLDDMSIQKILREVDTSDLIIALKKTAPVIFEKILRNMSNRAASLLIEDMEYIGDMSDLRIRECRHKIEEIGNKLLEAGDIFM